MLVTALAFLFICPRVVANRLDTQPSQSRSQPLNTSARKIECNAEKVKLDSTTGQQIQIFELQVFSSGINIALTGKATQSSSWSSGTIASKAIDGRNTTFSHTKDPDAFLEVDFGGMYSIERVVIVNRFCKDSIDSPGCLCRLSNATMSLMDNNGDRITTRSIGNTCGVTSLTFSFDSLETCCQSPSSSPSPSQLTITSKIPSANPSIQPFTNPSHSQTTTPTIVISPSDRPSLSPSFNPSYTISIRPSLAPTAFVSIEPIASPSSTPRMPPSTGPSASRQGLPSTQPTIMSSVLLSKAPSMVPSTSPSLLLSISPSASPSSNFRTSPSLTPTKSPSSRNSTSVPSGRPSGSPLINPTVSPPYSHSRIPALAASVSPSASLLPRPTSTPSHHPSPPPLLLPSTSPNFSEEGCATIFAIFVEWDNPTPSSKSSKFAKGGRSLVPTSSPTHGIRRYQNETLFCSGMKTWNSGKIPKSDTEKIYRISYQGNSNTYPTLIKLETGLGGRSSERVTFFVLHPATNSSENSSNIEGSDKVTIFEPTDYPRKIVTAALGIDQSYTFDDWHGTGKALVVSVRNITADMNNQSYAEVELNFDNAISNDSITNRIICGYQGWFAYPGDGAPVNKWRHWFSAENDPSVENLRVEMYPSMDEYNDEDLMQSNILMKDGSKAKFFSSARPNVVKKHFEWMREYGISGVFHMRFMQDIDKPANHAWKTMVLRNVRAAAEYTGRVFAVSYNIAGNSLNNTVLDDIKADWMDLVNTEQITQSVRYLHHNGLPVLRIYGIGFKTVKVSDTVKMANLIEWFKSEAESKYRVFLIGGVPSQWRDLAGDSREAVAWRGIYESLDGIHPWHVGRWRSISSFMSYNDYRIAKDAELCSELGILYMPTMWPGFSWHNLKDAPLNDIPRIGGKFMWSQAFSYARNKDIVSIWMAQFDEVDEGTAIFKVASSKQQLPAEGNWLSLDADGVKLPNDWYLRLCGEAQKMMLRKIELNDTIPIVAYS